MSNNPQIPVRIPYGEFSQQDLFDLLQDQIMGDLNCHAVGSIVSFDASIQVATAQIGYTRTIFVQDPVTGQLSISKDASQVNYPVVSGPAVILTGGKAYLNMPIAAGDSCLILFNDRDFDTWYSAQQGQPPAPVPTAHLHSFSDAIILVGLRPLSQAVASYDDTRATLTDGNVSVGINPSSHKATIKNTSEGTIGTILQDILTAIQNLTVTCAGSGSPSSVPVNASDFASYATKLQGLLE